LVSAPYGFAGSKYEVLWRFAQNGKAGYTPGGLIADSAGNLYGVTTAGGKYGSGTVYQLTPPATGGGDWTMSVIYSFPSGPGAGPAALILDSSGNLYGTTLTGDGTVFQLQRPANKDGKWTETDIYIFRGWDGYEPLALAFDAAGQLYGTTLAGGRYCGGFGCGTVYKLTPPAHGHGNWKRTVVYFFKGVLGNGNGDGSGPIALTFANDGNFYGTTLYGGTCQQGDCGGTVFQLAPPKKKECVWREKVLYRFAPSGDSNNPFSGVVRDKSGALYGTTDESVYQLLFVGGVWTLNTLLSGDYLYNGVILDKSGNVYGSILYDYRHIDGTVYKLSPPDWTETLLHAFAHGRDGSAPASQLVFGLDGALYGTTLRGGNNQCNIDGGVGCGTVFRVAP